MKNIPTTIKIIALLALLATLLLSGCLNYRVGTTLPPHLRSINVSLFANSSGEPNLETELQRALLQEIQREGQLKLLDAESAAIHLNGTIISYSLEPMRYDKDRPKTVAEYRTIIRAQIKATDSTNGKTIVSRTVVGDSTLATGGDLMTARRTALPEAARQLAHEIVNTVVSAW